jgi:hypothetical protein
MKKFRRILSGFLAAAIIMTQSIYAEPSGDQPATPATTTVSEQEGDTSSSSDETDAPESDGDPSDPGDTSPEEPGTPGDGEEGEEDENSDTTTPADEGSDEEEDEETEEEETDPVSIFEIFELTSSPDYIDKDNKLYPINDALDSIIVDVPSEELERASKELSKYPVSHVDRGSTYNFSSSYLYSKMTAADRAIYDQLDSACQTVLASGFDITVKVNFTDEEGNITGYAYEIGQADIGSMDYNRAIAIVNFFRFSNPQYYFVSNTIGTGYYGNSRYVSIYFVTVDGHDFTKYSERQTAQAALDDLTDSWMPQIMAAGGQLQRELKIRDLVADYITYDHYANDYAKTDPAAQARLTFDQSLISGVLNVQDGKHLTVCAGYAMMTAYFCNAAGIDAFYVNSNGHAWNIVELYKKYYELDLTWYDSDYGPAYYDNEWVNKSHATFLRNDQQSAHVYKAHWSNYTTLPSCTLDTVDTSSGLVSIEVTTSPDSITYTYGSPVDFAGGVLTEHYDSGEDVTVDMAEALANGSLTVTGYSATTLGSQTLTLKYGGKTTTLAVTVIVDPENPPVTMGDKNYLTLNAAFSDVTDSTKDYTIVINHQAVAEVSSVTIPATANSVTLQTADGVTLKTDTIKVQGNLVLDADVDPITATKAGPDVTIYANKTFTVARDAAFGTISRYSGTTTLIVDGATVYASSISSVTNINVNYGAVLIVSGNISSISNLNAAGFLEAQGNLSFSGTSTLTADGNVDVHGTLSGLTNFSGHLILSKTTSKATIANIVGSGQSFINLCAAENSGALTVVPLTVTNIADSAEIFLTVTDEVGNDINVPSGTKVMTAGNINTDFSARVTISGYNRTPDGKSLNAYKYDSDIRAEWAGALRLEVNGEVDYYPSFEKAFAAVVPGAKNEIGLIADIDVPAGKFNLPTNIGTGSLVISGEKLTLHNVSELKASYTFRFEYIELVDVGVTTLAISTSAGSIELSNFKTAAAVDLTLSGTDSADRHIYITESDDTKFGKVTGTASSKLSIVAETGAEIAEINKFAIFSNNGASTVVTTRINNVGEITGGSDSDGWYVKLLPTASLSVSKLNCHLCFIDDPDTEGLQLATVTASEVSSHAYLFVKDNSGNMLAVPSGTPLLTLNCTETAFNTFKNKIDIKNKTDGESGKELAPFYYASNNSSGKVLAEVADAVTLVVKDSEDDDNATYTDYQNLKAALDAVVKDKYNRIELNNDITEKEFALPDTNKIGTGSLVIAGGVWEDDELKKVYELTLPSSYTTLTMSPAYPFTIEYIRVNAKYTSTGAAVSAITINGSKDITLTDVAFGSPTDVKTSAVNSVIKINDKCDNIRDVIGYSKTTSVLEFAPYGNGITTVRDVKTFKTVSSGGFTATGSMTAIVNFEGEVTLAGGSEKSATIETISNNSTFNLVMTVNGDVTSFTKPTITGVADAVLGFTVNVTDGNGDPVALPSGTEIFKVASSSPNFTDRVSVGNKTEGGADLQAYKSGTGILAMNDGVVYFEIYEPDHEDGADPVFSRTYPNLEFALADVKPGYENNIYIIENTEISVSKINNANIGAGKLMICGSNEDGDGNEIPLRVLDLKGDSALSVGFDFSIINIQLKSVDRNNNPVQAFTISSSKSLYANNVKPDNANTKVNFKVTSRDSYLGLEDFDYEINSVTSSSSGYGWFGVQSGITVKDISNIGGLGVDTGSVLTITGTASVADCVGNDTDFGKVKLAAGAKLTTKDLNGADITLTKSGDTITPLTFTNAYEKDGRKVKITVVDADGNPVSLDADTQLFTMNCKEDVFYGSGYSGSIEITNKTAGNETLRAYYYSGKVRAQVGDALTLKYYDNGHPVTQNFPNFDLAFKAVKKDFSNRIELNEDITVTSLNLPTDLGTYGFLEIYGGEDKHTLTLRGLTSLSPSIGLSIINIKLAIQDSSGNQLQTFRITNSAANKIIQLTDTECGTKLDLTVAAGGYITIIGTNTLSLGTLEGKSTSTLRTEDTVTVENVKTFGTVELFKPLTVTNTLSGVGSIMALNENGELILPVDAQATITKTDKYADDLWVNPVKITLGAETDGTGAITKLAKLNLTNIDHDMVLIVKKDGTVIAVPEETVLFTMSCTDPTFYSNGYSGKITVANKTALDDTGKTLNAFYYTENRQGVVRAQYAGKLTLVVNEDDEHAQHFPNFELAFKAVTAGKDCVITLNEDVIVPSGKFTLPQKADALTIRAEYNEPLVKLTLDGVSTLSPAYQFNMQCLELDLGSANTLAINGSGGVHLYKIKTAAKVSLTTTSNDYYHWIEVKDCDIDFDTITGTSKARLFIYAPEGGEEFETIKTFDSISIGDSSSVTVNKSITGVSALRCTDENSRLILPAAATATITKLGYKVNAYEYGANIVLIADTDADDNITKLPNLTVSDVIYPSTLTVKDGEGDVIPVTSGTKLLTMSCAENTFYQGNYAGLLAITNKTAGDSGDTLYPYYYNKDVKAVSETAVELTIKNADAPDTVVSTTKYPTLALALKAARSGYKNEIALYGNIDEPSFTLPSSLGATGSLSIEGDGAKKSLTLHNLSSISPKYNFTLENIDLICLDRNGKPMNTFSISGSGSIEINGCSAEADYNGEHYVTTVSVSTSKSDGIVKLYGGVKYGTVTGYNGTSKLIFCSGASAEKIQNFCYADTTSDANVVVSGSITGVKYLAGNVVIDKTASATVTNLGYEYEGSPVKAYITLNADTTAGIKLPNLTISGAAADADISVKSDGNFIAIPSGTKILTANCTEAVYDTFKAKLSIKNMTGVNEEFAPTGNALTPYYYNREVRAEYGEAITLKVSGKEDRTYPNFEKAFKDVESDKTNTFELSENVDAKVFTLPNSLGTTGRLKIIGNGHTLTLHNLTSLAPRYEFSFNNVELIPLNSAGTAQVPAFSISGAKSVWLEGMTCDAATTINVTVGGTSTNLELKSNNAKFGTLTGTSTSGLFVYSTAEEADTVRTFSLVYLESPLTVNTSVTGVANVAVDTDDCELILPTTATATITDLGFVYSNRNYPANVTLLAETDTNGNITKLPNLTVTNIAADSSITVKKAVVNEGVTTYEAIPVPSGTKLFTLKCGQANFEKETYPTLTIKNGTEGIDGDGNPKGNPLTAYLYGSDLKAEFSGAIGLKVDDAADYTNYPSFVKVFEYISAEVKARNEHSYEISLNTNVNADAFAIPTSYTTGFSLDGCGNTLTLGTGVTSISAATNLLIEDITLNIKGRSLSITGSGALTLEDVIAQNVQPTVTARGALCTIGSIENFASVTGNKNNKLTVSEAPILNTVSDFKTIETDLESSLCINKSVSATEFTGVLGLMDMNASATFTTVTAPSEIHLIKGTDARGNDKIASLTMTKAESADATKFVTIHVKEAVGGADIALTSGTPMFKYNTSNAEIRDVVKIANKTDDDEPLTLTPFVYGTEVRAEYADALTFKVNNVEKGKYPNFEKAFAAVEANKINDIYINEDINVPYGKFTLPTAAQIGTGMLNIWGNTVTKTLTLNGVTTLSPRYTVNIDRVKLVPLDSSGKQLTSFTISGSKGVTLAAVTIDTETTVNVSVGAGSDLNIEATSAKFGTLTGTTTSGLSVYNSSITADKVTTFGIVTASHSITVNTSMTGVGELYGEGGVILHATATATITTLNGADITLLAETDENGNITKLAKPTITNVTYASTFTVKKPVVDEGGEITGYDTIAVPSGTPIFTFNGTEAQFDACKNLISIANKTATDDTGKELTPYYYNKEIRAEYADALTLSIGGSGKNYPSFEKLFPNVRKDSQNVIYLNDNIDASKFVLPTDLGQEGELWIKGLDYTLTLHNISSLSPRYEFDLEGITLVPLNSKGDAQVPTFTITGSKEVYLKEVICAEATTVNVTVGAGSNLILIENNAKFGTLSGTATSMLSVGNGISDSSEEADNVKTFKDVKINSTARFTVNTSMTGIGNVHTESDGKLILAPTATATFTTVDSGNIKLVYDDTKKSVPKATVSAITTGLTVEVIDENGDPIALTSGTPVLYAGTNTDITGKITISDTNGTFVPVLYSREIRAETPDVIKLEVGTITETFTSFEKLFQRITTLANADRTNQNNYVVTISGDLETKVFTLPTYGASFTVKSAEGTNHKLVLKGISISYKNYPVNFDDVDVTFVK